MIRQPAVAGLFYDESPEDLRETMDACFLGPYGPGRLPVPAPIITRNIVGLICPHAGYRFSGYATASAFFDLADDGLPDTAVLIGPNHRGIGAPAAIMPQGSWLTPFGEVEIDSDAARAIMGATDLVTEDNRAHQPEHSLEVQVPFLQYLGGKTKIVPILISIIAWEDALLYAEELGRAITSAIDGKNAVVIASTDLTHYQPKAEAERKDRAAIAAMESLDYAGLIDVVARMDISMCGVVPTAIALAAHRSLGAKRADLLSYYTSGDIIGDTSQVVGYGALKAVKD
ncbi:MAG: AmmeMemoRadiSam system protein B [Armatimonadota bacterium]